MRARRAAQAARWLGPGRWMGASARGRARRRPRRRPLHLQRDPAQRALRDPGALRHAPRAPARPGGGAAAAGAAGRPRGPAAAALRAAGQARCAPPPHPLSRAARAVHRRVARPRPRDRSLPVAGAAAAPRGAPPRLRAAPRVAGPRRVPAALACVAASALGELLSSKGLCARVPGEERECGMRSLYAMLQWASQRVADLVRVRGARAHRQRPPVPGGTRGARRGRRRAGRQPAAHACRRRPTRVSQRRA